MSDGGGVMDTRRTNFFHLFLFRTEGTHARVHTDLTLGCVNGSYPGVCERILPWVCERSPSGVCFTLRVLRPTQPATDLHVLELIVVFSTQSLLLLPPGHPGVDLVTALRVIVTARASVWRCVRE